MGVQLMKLRNVPDDEAFEVRALLTEHDIDFYETSPGLLGFSTPAIWLNNPEQLEQAKHLLESYQQQRYEKAKAAYEQQALEGRPRTFFAIAKEKPLQFLFSIALIALILYFSIKPFVELGSG